MNKKIRASEKLVIKKRPRRTTRNASEDDEDIIIGPGGPETKK